jgi:hypothetical protein
MNQISRVVVAVALSVSLAGCNSGQSLESSINKSELEKYVEENPVPPATAEDFD